MDEIKVKSVLNDKRRFYSETSRGFELLIILIQTLAFPLGHEGVNKQREIPTFTNPT
jgi:hypothetical protein